jgi:hypothetical protein
MILYIIGGAKINIVFIGFKIIATVNAVRNYSSIPPGKSGGARF